MDFCAAEPPVDLRGGRQWLQPLEYAIAAKLQPSRCRAIKRGQAMTSFAERVAKAAAAMRVLFPETPLQENDYLSKKTGAKILLKREDLTPVRSYKIRGAFNFFRKALAAGNQAELFVCASAGNHAQGFAFVCRHFGKTKRRLHAGATPQQKIDKTQAVRRRIRRDKAVRRLLRRLLPRRAGVFRRRAARIWCRPSTTRTSSRGRRPSPLRSPARCRAGARPTCMVLPVGGGGLAAGVTHYFREQGARHAFRLLRAGGRAEPQRKPCLRAGA